LGGVDIDLAKGGFAGRGMFCGEGFEDGRDDFAGTAPGCVDCAGGLAGGWSTRGREGVQSITTTLFLEARVLSCEGVVMCVYFVAMVDGGEREEEGELRARWSMVIVKLTCDVTPTP
jgi:hypothetical protein